MLIGRTAVATPAAERYLTQLCKHFAHKIPVSRTDDAALAEFAWGVCRLRAEPAVLHLECEAQEPESLARIKAVVEDHLLRFGWREQLSLTWQDG